MTTAITPNTGALGLAGQALATHEDTHAHPWIPPISLNPSGINFDQSVQFTSDQFEIAMNDSRAYLDRVEFAALAAGLLDPYLVPDLVDLISGDNGIVDEIELHCLGANRVSVVRGRDAASYLADSTVNVVYSVKVGVAPPPVPTSVPGFPLMPIIPGVTVPLTLVGGWRASTIAQDLCRRVGLTCLWQAHDYPMREDTTVNGPILSTIQSLVEPFSHFERSKTDIWAEGTTLIVRSRGTGGPGITLTAHDARISQLVIKAKFNGFIRMLKLTGSRTGVSPYIDVVGGDVETEDTESTPTSRTVTKRTTRPFDNAVKREVVETYRDVTVAAGFGPLGTLFEVLKMQLVSRQTTVSDWDELEIAFPHIALNKPKENSRVTTLEGWDPNGIAGVLEPTSRTTYSNSYDAEGYIRMQDTRKETFDFPHGGGRKTWVLSKGETKKYERKGVGMYEISTTQYGADGGSGDSHRTMANGTPPGGPGRGMPGGGDNRPFVNIGILISQAPGAKDITIANPNLLLSDLEIIKAQALAQSGTTEVSITFTASGMPWIRRGMYLTLTDLFAEDGTTPIPLSPALITDARVEYREAEGNPTYDTYVTAVFWEAGKP